MNSKIVVRYTDEELVKFVELLKRACDGIKRLRTEYYSLDENDSNRKDLAKRIIGAKRVRADLCRVIYSQFDRVQKLCPDVNFDQFWDTEALGNIMFF